MLEERGRVVAVEAGAVWVETQRRGSCGQCEAQASCGTGIWQQALRPRAHHLRARTGALQPALGDWVVLGVADGVVLQGALVLYLVPLVALVLGAGLGQWLGGREWISIVGAVAGLGLGLVAVRWRSRWEAGQAERQPVVLRIERPGAG